MQTLYHFVKHTIHYCQWLHTFDSLHSLHATGSSNCLVTEETEPILQGFTYFIDKPNVHYRVPSWQCCAGITQRMTRNAARQQSTSYAHAQCPCFHPLPESQPVLPCLLRRLLQKGKAQEALSLATSHSQAPHFARSLEWLLFTSLEINNEQMARPSRCAACLHHPGLLLGSPFDPQRHRLFFLIFMLAQLQVEVHVSNFLLRVLSRNSCSVQTFAG